METRVLIRSEPKSNKALFPPKLMRKIKFACSLPKYLKQTFHWSAFPLRSWRSWSFFKLFQIATEACTFCQISVLARFKYASTKRRIRFCYDPTTTMKIRRRLVYADGIAVQTLPRPRRLSYVFVAIDKIDSLSGYVQLNVNCQRYE